jgi:CheY-like chemotaxis protein
MNPAITPNIEPVEILLVEDSLPDVILTQITLEKYHVTNNVHVARDGAEALDYLFGAPRTSWPRVVLLDLKLPKVDGVEVLRRIRADARTRTLPVVMLTGSSEERDLRECYTLGVNSYIVKPLEFAQFTEVIRTIGLYWTLYNKPPLLPTGSTPPPDPGSRGVT